MPHIIKTVALLSTILTITSADVKHVLDGIVPSAKEINDLGVSNSFASASASFSASSSGHGTFQGPGKADFWWMDVNSPLKHAYDYFKKCQESGDCIPPINPLPNGCQPCDFHVAPPIQIPTHFPLDINKNPFLNGNFQGISISSCTGPTCKDGKSETVVTTCKGDHCESKKYNLNGENEKIDVSKNPFLNGAYNPQDSNAGFGSPDASTATSRPPRSSTTPSPPIEHGDINKNPFFNGAYNPQDSNASFGNPDTSTTASRPPRPPTTPAPPLNHRDINKNPFFNGDYKPEDSKASFGNATTPQQPNNSNKPSSTTTSPIEVEKIDISKNPFLNGGKNSAFAGNGDLVFNDGNGFIGVQPSQPFGGKNSSLKDEPHQYKPFPTTHPGLKECPIAHVCLPKQFCPNGKLTKQEDLINAKNVSKSFTVFLLLFFF